MFGGLGSLFGGGGMFNDDNSNTDVSSGGIGNSTSENQTDNYDASVNAGNNSTIRNTTNLINGGTNTLVDPGAIQLAQDVAQGAMAHASDLTNTALTGVIQSVHELRGSNEHALGLVKDAYADARTGDASRTTLIIGALAALGLLAMSVQGKKA